MEKTKSGSTEREQVPMSSKQINNWILAAPIAMRLARFCNKTGFVGEDGGGGQQEGG